ncbi:Cysteine protease family C48 [Phytophthora palmivora]|uniref:Cysteine protease family C48 n=1 Tax=Phytophthora palmivora TaxID=4796 RepID=A0A2P4Y0A3_9STRA|nr:Cysteine protease family C48 [Phytophthora palmivora]
MVSACGTSMLQEIELASGGCRNPATKIKALRKAINNFDWGAYHFVLLPIGGLNHWGLAIIENFMLPEDYHIDSLKWFLSGELARRSGCSAEFKWSTCVYKTKPQQTNCVDCGIYLLHYMDKMATGIVGLQSKSILGQVETWCQSGFNSPKAERLRTFLRQRIHCDSEA